MSAEKVTPSSRTSSTGALRGAGAGGADGMARDSAIAMPEGDPVPLTERKRGEFNTRPNRHRSARGEKRAAGSLRLRTHRQFRAVAKAGLAASLRKRSDDLGQTIPRRA